MTTKKDSETPRPVSFVNEPYSDKSEAYRIIGAKYRVKDLEESGKSLLGVSLVSIPINSHEALLAACREALREAEECDGHGHSPKTEAMLRQAITQATKQEGR